MELGSGSADEDELGAVLSDERGAADVRQSEGARDGAAQKDRRGSARGLARGVEAKEPGQIGGSPDREEAVEGGVERGNFPGDVGFGDERRGRVSENGGQGFMQSEARIVSQARLQSGPISFDRRSARSPYVEDRLERAKEFCIEGHGVLFSGGCGRGRARCPW